METTMTQPETKWISIATGVMSLPTTKFAIEYVSGSAVPFRASWDGKKIPDSCHFTLASAMEACEKHMQELITMGFEV